MSLVPHIVPIESPLPFNHLSYLETEDTSFHSTELPTPSPKSIPFVIGEKVIRPILTSLGMSLVQTSEAASFGGREVSDCYKKYTIRNAHLSELVGRTIREICENEIVSLDLDLDIIKLDYYYILQSLKDNTSIRTITIRNMNYENPKVKRNFMQVLIQVLSENRTVRALNLESDIMFDATRYLFKKLPCLNLTNLSLTPSDKEEDSLSVANAKELAKTLENNNFPLHTLRINAQITTEAHDVIKKGMENSKCLSIMYSSTEMDKLTKKLVRSVAPPPSPLCIPSDKPVCQLPQGPRIRRKRPPYTQRLHAQRQDPYSFAIFLIFGCLAMIYGIFALRQEPSEVPPNREPLLERV